ncbi:MAG: hypothetical protein ACXWNK_06160 [Vulcanimicrobiaceae bacterium]
MGVRSENVRSYIAVSFLCVGLAACGGGSGATPTPVATTAPTSRPTGNGQLVPTSFSIRVPSSTSKNRQPDYVTANVKSIIITLDSVDGGAPPAGITTSVTANLLSCASGCTVAGPSAPPGSDGFTLTTFDNTNGSGNTISIASQTFTIVQGQNNANNVTLLGIPKTFTIAALPSGTAGTAFASPATLTLTVNDADGNAITGTFANPVTVTDSDTSSLTQGTALSVNGGTTATSVTVNASTDVLTLNYGGLAIAPAAIKANASGATAQTATFTPTLAPIGYSGPLNGATPQIDLYATSGTGSTGAFTVSETGLTNAPYNKTLTATPAGGCATIGNLGATVGTSFTATAVASPTAGSCTIGVTDGLGQSKNVTLTYTTSQFGVQ